MVDRERNGAALVEARRVRIQVGELTIEDGQTRPPALGDVGWFWLSFVESAADRSPATNSSGGAGSGETGDATVVSVRAWAEPLGDGTPRGPGHRWDGTPNDGPTVWPTVLRGDGWTATWSAPRPVLGHQLLRGRLIDDLDPGLTTGVRGRVTRVRVISETIDTSDPDRSRWRPIPARRQLRDVDAAPRWFDRGLVTPPEATTAGWYVPVPADPYVVETGVLVDLDLDQVPAPAPRPSIVPGALAAAGPDLWVADVRLPVLVRVRHPTSDEPEITTYGWPARILTPDESRARRLHADPDGCWITGPDGLHRADHTGTVHPVRAGSTGPATGLAAHRGTLLEQHHHECAVAPGAVTLCLTDPHGRVTDRSLDDGSVSAAVPLGGAGDGFLLLLRHTDHLPDTANGRPGGQTDPRPWLAELTSAGGLRHGPYLHVGHPGLVDLVAGSPPLLVDGHGSGLRRVHTDLTLSEPSTRWQHVLRCHAAAGRVWVAVHPPHPHDIARRGGDACWPLTGPPVYPEDRQYWLLTELDPDTLDPLLSTLVQQVPEHVAVDDTGTVWVQAAGARRLPPGDGAAAELLDVAAHLDRQPGPRDHPTPT